MTIRAATPDDAPELLAIYASYIDTPITFEFELPSKNEFVDRISDTLKTYPYLVLEENGKIRGYAYAGAIQSRAAYQWGAELSIYLDRDFTGHGRGTKLYRCLIECLKSQGIRTVYGCVTTPNPASKRLHEKSGFSRIGVFRNAGFKNGEWRDIAWFEKSVGEYSTPTQLTAFKWNPDAIERSWK